MTNIQETKNKNSKRKRKLITWSDFDDMKCIVMADFGQSAKTIGKVTALTPAQVYYRTKKYGIRITDWRNGRGRFGEVLFTRFTIISNELNADKQIKRLFGLISPPRLEGKVEKPSI